jgi:hypothetical protein
MIIYLIAEFTREAEEVGRHVTDRGPADMKNVNDNVVKVQVGLSQTLFAHVSSRYHVLLGFLGS